MNLLLYTERMRISEIRPLLDTASIPTYTIPSFIAFTELDPAKFDDFVDMASEETINRLVTQFQREEKFSHAPERKRPWKPVKTRFPVEGKLRELMNDTNFKKKMKKLFSISWRIVKRVPVPQSLMQANRKGPGRPPVFNWLRIVAVIIMTFYLFDAVWYAKVLIDLLDINVTVNYRSRRISRSPSVDEIYKIYQKIPESYLHSVLRILDDWARKHALKHLGLVCDVCIIDGSAESEHCREECMIAGETRLRTRKVDYTAAVRFFTNTVILAVSGTPKDITKYYDVLRDANIYVVIADGYFRTYANSELAVEYGMKFITRSKNGSKVWRYDRRYRVRKLIEILFGGIWMRSKRRLFGRGRGGTYKKQLLRLIGHNFKAYERIVVLGRLFARVPMLEEAYLSI